MLKELDDLRQLLLRLVGARHVIERHFDFIARAHSRSALAERHHFAARALRLLHDEKPYAYQQQDRQE